LPRKGAKSQAQGRKLHSTRTQAEKRVDRMRRPPPDLEPQLESSRRELAEAQKHLTDALEQQAATSEILRVIRSSPNSAQPVFDTIVANAVRLLPEAPAPPQQRTGNAQQRRRHKALMRHTAARCFPSTRAALLGLDRFGFDKG
jgi:hypothetical protein